MTRFALWRKIIAQFLMLTLLAELAPLALFAAEGPATPEAAQFEPVDTSDMVNLYTGDFVYNVPLLEIPGPEGGWPINMSYHAGIGPNTEATWVGLGWSLNPGAINRLVNGYPDDFLVGVQEFYTKKKLGEGYGISVGISVSGASAGINYDSYQGFGANLGIGISDGLSIGISGTKNGIGASVSFGGTRLSVDPSGIGLSQSLTLITLGGDDVGHALGLQYGMHSKRGLNGGVGLYAVNGSDKSIELVGANFSSQSSGASFSMLGGGINSHSNHGGQIDYKSSGFVVPLPVGLLWGDPFTWATVGYQHYEGWLKINEIQGGVGTLYNTALPQSSYQWTKTIGDLQAGMDNAYDDWKSFSGIASFSGLNLDQIVRPSAPDRNVLENNRVVSAEDIYQVSAQGLSGTFTPYLDYAYHIDDIWNPDLNVVESQYNRLPKAQGYRLVEPVGGEGGGGGGGQSNPAYWENTGPHIKFRMDNDLGSNFVNLQSYDENTLSPIGIDGAQWGSKRIIPAINEFGSIVGFKIITEDGRIYEFYQPVMEYGMYSKSTKDDDVTRSWLSTPYASSWLITGIKGPDYIDRGVPGFSKDDYGFWVKFRYSRNDHFTFWRTPYSGTNRDPEDLSEQVFSSGARETLYLESIETPSHLARFVKSDRLDNKPSYEVKREGVGRNWKASSSQTVTQYLSVVSTDTNCFRMSTSRWDIISSTRAKFYFNVPKEYFDKFVPTQKSLLSIKYMNGLSCCEDLGSVDKNLFATPTNYYSVGNYTAVEADFSGIDLMQSDKIVGATVFIQPEVFSSQVFSKRLDSIMIHKKVFSGSQTDYAQTYSSPFLESIHFDYDYSLCPGAVNSDGGGKLTLRGATKKGSDGLASLPKTIFDYANNPTFDKEKWNHWNGYTSNGNFQFHGDNGPTADIDAGAWNLTSISTALGGVINIEYEADRFSYVNNNELFSILNDHNSSLLAHSEIEAATGPQTSITIIDDRARVIELFRSGMRDFKLRRITHNILREEQIDQVGNIVCSCCVDQSSFQFQETSVKIASINGMQAILETPYSFGLDEIDDPCNGVEYTYQLYAEPAFYGGGYRVRSISVTDENEQKRTQYRYESGIANSLPAGYKGIFSQNTLYNHEFNLLGPGPGVGYSKVSVYETDATGQMIGAKIVHEYFTGKDFPFTVTVGNVTWNYEYNEYRQPVTIVDQTGMYGKIKRITVLGLKQTSGPPEEIDFDPVRTDDFLYQMSSALGTSEIPINGDISDQRFKQIYLPSFEPLDQSQLLGLTQRSYKTTGGKPSSGNIFITAYIDLRRENVFLVGTKSKTYPANGVSQSTAVETRSYTIAYDALSGRDQCTESSTSKQERLIAESIPAYWNYEGMRAKNMLSQESIKRTYLLGPSDDFFSLRSNSALYPKLLSASATTWKDWHNTDLNEDNVVTSNEQSWRQNDTYTATKTGSNHFDFTIWTAADNESTNPETYDFPNGWRRTSNITAYDRYGHPTEERGLDGTYTSSIYGYGDALPIAIAQNAKTSQIRFYNFENSSYTSGGKTGDYSKLYSGTVAEMATPNVPGTYMISGWIKPTSSTTVGGKTYPADGQWHYFEVKNVTANTTPSLSGQGVIDDIRIHPMDATMSTFTYDNLTWKVTAISDANSIITYYEYDGAGRLVKVYDQDKNLIKKHTYQYRRN